MSDATKKPPIQFGLSGLMLIVLAVALGCFGWKLGAWMWNNGESNETNLGVAAMLLTATAIVAVTAMIVGGRRACICSVVGFLVNLSVLVGAAGLPPVDALFYIPWLALLFGLCLPLAAVAGTIVNMWREPSRLNVALAVTSCFSAGWILSLIYMNSQRLW